MDMFVFDRTNARTVVFEDMVYVFHDWKGNHVSEMSQK